MTLIEAFSSGFLDALQVGVTLGFLTGVAFLVFPSGR